MRSIKFTLAIIFFLGMIPAAAYANSMGGLVFLVFIWPIGIILFLLHLVLSIIAVRLKKDGKQGAGAFTRTATVLSILTFVAFPLTAIILSNSYDARAPGEVILISVLPVEIMAAVTLFLCRRGGKR